MCRGFHKSGRRAFGFCQTDYSQAVLGLLALMSAILVRGQCEEYGSKSTYIGRDLPLHPDDLKALEAFRDGMKATDNLLDNWNISSHPCEWCGVLCMCSTVQTRLSRRGPVDCPEGGRYPNVERVFGLDLGESSRPPLTALTGPLPTEIGLLSEVKMVYMQYNIITCVPK